jgi:hypothetical protein
MGVADKDYFLDDAGNVTADEEKAAFVLIRAGQDIPKEMADKYGIGKVAQTEEATADETVEEKAAKAIRRQVGQADEK